MKATDQDPAVELAYAFRRFTKSLEAAPDADSMLQHIGESVTEMIKHCDGAGVTLLAHTKGSAPASDDQVLAALHAIGSETGDGPWIDAIAEDEPLEVRCLSEERRWPKFSRQASGQTGVESILAFPLIVPYELAGALNLYSTRRDAFDQRDVAIGSALAAHTALAYTNRRKIETLQMGMQSRQIIGQAVGILMARQGVSDSEAFDMLRRASQRMNVKLRHIAEQMIERSSTAIVDPASIPTGSGTQSL